MQLLLTGEAFMRRVAAYSFDASGEGCLYSILFCTYRCALCLCTGDDAALVRPPQAPAYLVHSIDYFRSFISDPFLMGQIAVNHALSGRYDQQSRSLTSVFVQFLSAWAHLPVSRCCRML
jgi:hypothetical protein